MSLNRKKATIIEEIYVTGRYRGMYMGVHSNNKQNPIKSYLRQWLVEKGIRTNLDETIEDFYQELFYHIGKMKAETLVELTKNNKKLFATICTIIQRQLMKVDVNPIINHLKKTLNDQWNLNQDQLQLELDEVEVSDVETKELKKVNKKQLKTMVEPSLDYLLKLLKVHQDIQNNKIQSTNVSYFEKMKHNSIQFHQSAIEQYQAEEEPEDEESTFAEEFRIGINDIMESMSPIELEKFKTLANKKNKRPLKGMTKEQKEEEKQYWDNLETQVLNTINRIKFNK